MFPLRLGGVNSIMESVLPCARKNGDLRFEISVAYVHTYTHTQQVLLQHQRESWYARTGNVTCLITGPDSGHEIFTDDVPYVRLAKVNDEQQTTVFMVYLVPRLLPRQVFAL